MEEGRGEGSKRGGCGRKDQQRWGANEIDGTERGKAGGKDRRAAADLFKNQGPELATVNFSSYS